MKTMLDLPNDLAQEIKLRATREGRKLKDEITELLRRGLAATPQAPQNVAPARVEINTETGLPFVQCAADAPISRMNTAEIYALMQQSQQEEDLARLGLSL